MSNRKNKKEQTPNKKINDLLPDTNVDAGEFLTTNQGLKINNDEDSLKAGERGASMLEDFILREKITHFDHERIPERVVHARGVGAHGTFEVYESLSKYTKAKFLQDPSVKTPVFVRFSTVAGFRGSTDLARDVRGFSIKFYTEEGNYDFVGNNMPVFFIQDAIKFPDLIHAVKPEPDTEVPQAASAHNTFWDFISLFPESAHMIMWIMSDRAIPRSLRMMDGFGVHSFRLINKEGKAVFAKFHWKSLQGVYAVAWDEAQRISGKDSDFHRRDLYDAINSGAFPEWELGLQIIEEKDEFKFPFDILDPTKIIPEEMVPVQRVGKLTLNRNVDNFFSETEQVAFHPGHLVPGIDFTNDPLLQGRLFSYTDTQLTRLGGPNFHEIPINRSVSPMHNNQRDGHMRQTINVGVVSYHPNSLGSGHPAQAKMAEGGFTSYPERIDGKKIRGRSASFMDYFSQAALFFNSQSDAEKSHLTNALRFELGKVKRVEIRKRMVGILSQIDAKLAADVARELGIEVQAPEQPINKAIPADADPKAYNPKKVTLPLTKSAALSMANNKKDSIQTRQVAILACDGADESALKGMMDALKAKGAVPKIVAPHLGNITGDKGGRFEVGESLRTTASVLFDAVYVPGGAASIKALKAEPDSIHFLDEAYKHCKAIAADHEGLDLLKASYIGTLLHADGTFYNALAGKGLIINSNGKSKNTAVEFIAAIAQHRFWEREQQDKIPA